MDGVLCSQDLLVPGKSFLLAMMSSQGKNSVRRLQRQKLQRRLRAHRAMERQCRHCCTKRFSRSQVAQCGHFGLGRHVVECVYVGHGGHVDECGYVGLGRHVGVAPREIMKLKKAAYELAGASVDWYLGRSTGLKKHGWRRLKSDPCCWILIEPYLFKKIATHKE